MPFRKLMLAVPVLLGLSAAQARAQLVITPTFDSTWSADPNAAADEARITSLITNTYDKNYSNPISVAIDFSVMNTGLGESFTSYYATGYTSYRTALTNDKQIAHGGDGNTAFLAELPANNPVPGNSAAGVLFSSAQGRALGFNTPGGVTVGLGTFDSQISLNIGLIDSDGYGLESTASHEIDEVLGLHSALDGRGNVAGTPTLGNVGALDFFRYSAPGVRSFTSDNSATSYFSDDGGATKITGFNQDSRGDFHDWYSVTQGPGFVPQVQDAFGTPGTDPALGASEFQALNDIGYNRVPANPVPEASTTVSFGLLLALGLGGVVIAAKRKKASA